MMYPDDKQIKDALDSCLSGVDALPSQRAEILRAAKGEMKVKRKMNLGLVLALILVLLTTTAAVAEALGLFGQIGQNKNSDSRLPGLESVSTVVDKAFDVGGGVTVTINQAYYDGTRVFVSYTEEGPHTRLETGTGRPDIVNYDRVEEGVIYGERYFTDGPAGREMAAWLDGSEDRWATYTHVDVHDGMQSGEEYLEIIGGDQYLTEDGKIIAWKECVVPEEIAADELSVSLGVFTTSTTYCQTPDALGVSYGTQAATTTTWHTFTVKKDTSNTALTGSIQTADWSAQASLNANAIDVKGSITLLCPEEWTDIWFTWENPDKIDYIDYWKFYIGDAAVEDHSLNGGIRVAGDGKLEYSVCYKLDALAEDMKLVPVYRHAGEKPAEAILLTIK